MSSDGTPSPDDEVTLAELAALRAGELSAEEEGALRTRMTGDPEIENKLWALDNVHRLFAKPSRQQAEVSAEMPYDVAARLQARVAERALHRSDPANLGGAACARESEDDEAGGGEDRRDGTPVDRDA